MFVHMINKSRPFYTSYSNCLICVLSYSSLRYLFARYVRGLQPGYIDRAIVLVLHIAQSIPSSPVSWYCLPSQLLEGFLVGTAMGHLSRLQS